MESDATAGLSAEECRRRADRWGRNELPQERPRPAWRLLLRQLENVLMLVLLAALGLSIAVGQRLEAFAIAVIVAFTVVLGFLQERKAQKAVQGLRALAAPKARVVRAAQTASIDAADLVPGDLILLAAGDRVPADARLIESHDLEVAEASLTGESVPVEKVAKVALAPAAVVADRHNMVHAATLVTRGRANAVVTAIGSHTEVGAIGNLLAGVQSAPTPLEKQLTRLARWLVLVAAVIVAATVGLGLARGHGWTEMLLFGVAMAVAVVPEALPAVVTISLALGAQRMARRNAIVRRLPVVETLGSTTIICSDKTGTLTVGEMTAVTVAVGTRIFHVSGSGYSPEGVLEPSPTPAESKVLEEVALASVLCNDSQLVLRAARWTVEGDPTEGALVSLGEKLGVRHAEARHRHPRRGEVGFTSERKRMTTLHDRAGGAVAYSKGAPEVVLLDCAQVLDAHGRRALSATEREAIAARAQDLANQGMRVLALSMHDAPKEGLEGEHTFLALVGLKDPLRPEAKDAIETCRAAGIRAVMITGDHPATAKALAAELGILRDGTVMTGTEIEALPPARFAASANTVAVYARVSPAHKVAIVEALQAQHHVVAMTGDGVNDAPALRKADIGVAMGLGGTDVAREAAAMMLADDNFATIVAAVEEGRGIFDNIRKYVLYLTSTNLGEVVLIAGAMLIGLPLPLTAVQILYVNLLSDGPPAIALAVDPHEPDAMRRPPRPLGAPMLGRSAVVLLVLGGLWSALANLGLFAWSLASGRSLAEATTIVFVSLVLIQFAKAYVFRSERRPIWHRPWSNRWLNRAVAVELVFILAILYVPALRALFGIYPLDWVDWVAIIVASLVVVPVLEIAKAVLRDAPPAGATP